MKNLKQHSKNLTILFVEDDINASDEISDILSIIFKKVIVAIDGIDALNKYEAVDDIDLILTDINMPRLNGIGLIEKIREQNKDIPIIVLSAHSEVNYFLNTIRLGVDGYILKPIELSVFTVVLQNVVNKINLKKENLEYKKNLEIQVQNEIEKRLYQEKILIQQSKLAAMGEMIDAIAHQWKQPLNIMSLQTDMLQYDYEDGYINKEYIDTHIEKFQQQVTHTLTTLDEFRKFFRPNSENQKFKISDTIDSVLVLVKDEFLKNKIKIEQKIQCDIQIMGHENEFKHLILNIINNSKDAFIENNIENRIITITLNNFKDSLKLELIDNAGGIPLDIIDDIFKPNITTKPIGKGTGIGLYMSSQIAEKIDGKLRVENIGNGAKFIFEKLYE